MGNYKSKRAYEAAVKNNQALTMRLEGKTFREIGEALNCDKSYAQVRVKTAIQSIMKDKAEEFLAITFERLEALLDDAMEGGKTKQDTAWHDQARKIIADQRKMLGLDKPAQTEIGGIGGGPINVQVEAQSLDLGLEKLAKNLRAKEEKAEEGEDEECPST